VQQKIETNSRNAVLNYSAEEKPIQNKTRQPNISKIVPEKTNFDVQTNQSYFAAVCKTNFFLGITFCSVPSLGIGSSAELGMPRNECFLSRNNGNRSEYIPRNFVRNGIPFPTLITSHLRGMRKCAHTNHKQKKQMLNTIFKNIYHETCTRSC
jgi:hypothetical protein